MSFIQEQDRNRWWKHYLGHLKGAKLWRGKPRSVDGWNRPSRLCRS